MKLKHLFSVLLLAVLVVPMKSAAETGAGNPAKASYIVISKESMTLKLYDADGKIIYDFPVAVGKNYGNKRCVGDKKTPEGEFSVQQIQNASSWTHDFKDGKGIIKGAYGNWFIRLLTPPHRGIGIHGTHDPSSIGTRASEGCIRLHNENLNKLEPLVKVGMRVIIEPSQQDLAADGKLVEVQNNTQAQPAATEAVQNQPKPEAEAETKAVEETKATPTQQPGGMMLKPRSAKTTPAGAN